MTDAANAQIAFITLFTTAFLAALYVLIVVISLLRRLRQTVQRPALNPVVEIVPAAQPPPGVPLLNIRAFLYKAPAPTRLCWQSNHSMGRRTISVMFTS